MTTVELLLVARSVLKEYSWSLCVVFVNVVRNRTFSSFGWKLEINLIKSVFIKSIQKQSYDLPLLWYWLCPLHGRYKLAPETLGRALSSWCCTETLIIISAVILLHLLWYSCNQICDPKDKMVFFSISCGNFQLILSSPLPLFILIHLSPAMDGYRFYCYLYKWWRDEWDSMGYLDSAGSERHICLIAVEYCSFI